MIYSIIMGALAGWIASMFMNKNAEMGWLKNIIAGILGGGIGRWILGIIISKSEGGVIYDLLAGVIGACILIAIINLITGKRKVKNAN